MIATLHTRLRSLPARNAAWSVAEYLTQPLLMLASAPFLLHHLGMEQYAIWLLASAAVSSGTLLSSGFGDAAIKYISACRGRGDLAASTPILRTLLAFNLVLALMFAALIACASPFLAAHLPHLNSAQQTIYLHSLFLGCLLIVIKSAESVFIAAQRACEHYAAPTRISIATRSAIIVVAVTLAARGGTVVSIMLATDAIALLGLILQAAAVARKFSPRSIVPAWHREIFAQLAGFGVFCWLQGLVGLLVNQADRILVGYLLGAPALAYYALCVQIAMPIHGITAAAFQVLFPYFGARTATRRHIYLAFAFNLVFVAALTAPVVLGARFILSHWLGADFAVHATTTLMVTALGFALLALNVSGYYILLAMGRVRLVALTNIAAAVAMLAAIALLATRFGILGAAGGRLLYGPITCLTCIALFRGLRSPATTLRPAPIEEAYELT